MRRSVSSKMNETVKYLEVPQLSIEINLCLLLAVARRLCANAGYITWILPLPAEITEEFVWLARLALVCRCMNVIHSWYLVSCWVDKWFRILLVFVEYHSIAQSAHGRIFIWFCERAFPWCFPSKGLVCWGECDVIVTWQNIWGNLESRELVRRIHKIGGV